MNFTISHLELPVSMNPANPFDDDALLRFCADNSLLRIERTSRGEVRVMSPMGSGTGAKNAEIIYQLTAWSRSGGGGVVFDSSAGFSLSDGSMMSPDAAWIATSRWQSLTGAEQERFAPICPDFVIELRSPSDRIVELEIKMLLWIENGAKLAWLIDPKTKTVAVYQPGIPVKSIAAMPSIVAEEIVSGFRLDLSPIWL